MGISRRIIENVFDLDNFSVEDPNDPDLIQSLEGRTVMVYAPIKPNDFWDTLSKGISMSDWYSQNREDRRQSQVYLSSRTASDHASYLNDYSSGIVVVFEVPVKNALKGPYARQLAIRALGGPQLIPRSLNPEWITGIIIAHSDECMHEIPVRDAIKRAAQGEWEDIGVPPRPGSGIPSIKYSKATPDEWQTVALKRVNDLINYVQTYFHYLIGADQAVFAQKFLAATGKMDLNDVLTWKGDDWLNFLEQTFGDKIPEDDRIEAATNAEHYNIPFYRLMKKFNPDSLSWRRG